MICDFRLKVFHTVAVKGSFTAAAKELGITQPAVSNHIYELETAVGDSLFHRSRTGTVLTQKGQILFDYAERILYLYHCADMEIVPTQKSERRHLTIACVPEAARFVIKPLAEYFSRIHPGADVSILERSMEESSAMLRKSEIDLAVTDTPDTASGSTVFVTVNIAGASSPMRTFYISKSQNPAANPAIEDFLLCCKTFR
ncbi:MAG TPA: LysR family transcriptional regulator [Candidatus Coprenecus pullistercoris]|nr:LysR family transcriptional regulator [Candidatus Coprenecus pullistercoris]